MESLDIVFSRSSNPFAAAIRAYPPSGPYSHCALYIPEERVFIEALASEGGVVYTSEEEFRDRASVYKAYKIEVPDRKAGIDWAKSTLGDKYDWSFVFSIPFRVRDWQKEGAWACSEHCAILTRKAGLDIIAPGMHGLTPNHFHSILYAAGAKENTNF